VQNISAKIPSQQTEIGLVFQVEANEDVAKSIGIFNAYISAD
jgi:hypothetical protein